MQKKTELIKGDKDADLLPNKGAMNALGTLEQKFYRMPTYLLIWSTQPITIEPKKLQHPTAAKKRI